MRFKSKVIAGLLAILLGAVLYAAAQEHSKVAATAKVLETASTSASGPDSASVVTKSSHLPALMDAAERRAEGQKRFHANCGRCHMAPHKFPPRMMATIERHMRVRATVTAEDMQFILGYMTE